MLTFNNKRNKPPYPKAQANRIKSRFVDSSYLSGGYIVYFQRPYFQKRLKQRKLIIQDALHILSKGLIIKEPDFENGEWRYVIEGDIVSKAGKYSLVVTFISEKELHFQTIF